MKKHIAFSFSPVSIAAFVLLSVSCASGEHQIGPVADETISPMETVEVEDMSDYISEIDIVPIDGESPRMLSAATKLLFAEDKYVILAGNMPFAVGKDGKILKHYGNFGRGPGEYLMVRDMCLSTNKKELWCLTETNTILRFDLNEFNFLGKISVDIGAASATGIVPMAGNSVAVFVPNPPSNNLTNFDENFYCLRYYSITGEETGQDLLRDDFNIDASFMAPISAMSGNRYFLSPGSPQTPCILFENGKVSKTYNFDFQQHTLPYRYAVHGDDSPWMKITPIFMSDYYKLTACVSFLDDALYFTAFGKNSSLWNFMIGPDGKGIRWRSFSRMSMPFHPIGADKNYLYYFYEDFSKENIVEETDLVKKIIINRGQDILSEDCPALVKIKFSL